MRRVVVTGLGVVSPIGLTTEESWKNAVEGNSGISKISLFDSENLPVHIAGEVKNFDSSKYLDIKEARRTTRFVQFAVAAAKEAVVDSGVDTSGDSTKMGCSIGVGLGALRDIENNTITLKEKGPRRVSPFFIPYTIPNMAAGIVSMHHKLQGPNICPTTACTSGTHGIGEGFLYIRQNLADVMVCGGAESTISPLGITAFSAMKALSTRNEEPEIASSPFDARRDGFVMGEGAGIMVLEEYEHAKKRGAKIYAELVGYGMSADAYHITSPAEEGEGAQRCMKMAMEMANISGEEIDYINAHGTSTPLNDQFESEAIMGVFKEHAKKIGISSTKGVTGHCIGAAGGIEGVFSALSVSKSIMPPTAHYEFPDPKCPLDYVPKSAREQNIRYALSNSFGFGGTNGTLIFKKF